MKKETPLRTLLVAVLLCIVCSVLVSTAAVTLQSRQRENKKLDIQKNVLLAAGILSGSRVNKEDIQRGFRQIETVLAGGKTIYLVKEEGAGEVTTFILPIEGKGLWSTLYGFLALEADTRTVVGIGFYQHGETPGLGGEVDNSQWKASWKGKRIVDEEGRPILQVVKGGVDQNSSESFRQIDGLSGATITARGVENLVNYWLGPEGHGPFLERFRREKQEKEKREELQ